MFIFPFTNVHKLGLGTNQILFLLTSNSRVLLESFFYYLSYFLKEQYNGNALCLDHKGAEVHVQRGLVELWRAVVRDDGGPVTIQRL